MDTKSICELLPNALSYSSKSWIAEEIKKSASAVKVFFSVFGVKGFILQQATTRDSRDLGEGKTEQIK